MALFSGRTGRRRRVLNEEVLSASSTHHVMRAVDREATDEEAPRYSDAASVENHPQVTDFVPRRFRTLAMVVAIGLGSTAVLEVLHNYAGRLSEVLGPWATAAIDLTASGSLAAWLSAVLLLVASITCLLIYSLRRHKIADFRGRYRIWLAAAAACLLLSVDSVAAFHRLLAVAASHFTQWTALRGDAIWWLALGGIPLSWIAVRVLLDVSESRLAISTFVASIAAYVVATASYLGWLSALVPANEPMVTVGATLVGHWLLLVAVVSYARFVVLDAQGLVPVRISRWHSRSELSQSHRFSQADQETTAMVSRSANPDREYDRSDEDEENVPFVSDMKSFRRRMKNAKQSSAAASSTQWVDGSEPDVSGDEDDGPGGRQRKLSKAERKRLRKLKARDQAA